MLAKTPQTQMNFLSKNAPEETVIIEERITKVNGDFHIKKYAKGKLLGRGGFAKAYMFTNLENNKILAGKIIPKENLNRSRSRQKLMVEIKLHQSLHHQNIVKFEHVFEDQENVYIMLELCHNQSMSDLLKRRKRLTEFEMQCYLIQIIDALKHIHSNRIIHRDLKLGNLFLNDKMQVKVGDFGLAAKLEFHGEKKRTLCGTPNYIAPEILDGNIGHSYQVDTWSIGVIIYTALVGKPPFETTDIKLTYKKIKENDYSFPDNVTLSENVKDLIRRILVTEPEKRLTLDEILQHPFIDHGGPIPKLMPLSTLACPPSSSYMKQFASSSNSQRIRIATEPDTEGDEDTGAAGFKAHFINTARMSAVPKTPSGNKVPITDLFLMTPKTPKHDFFGPNRFGLLDPGTPLSPKMNMLSTQNTEEAEEVIVQRRGGENRYPRASTTTSIPTIQNHESTTAEVRAVKWYDYSAKYGFGYALSNGSVGISFNDGSKMISMPGDTFTMIVRNPVDKRENSIKYSFKEYPQDVHKKILIYNHFKQHFESAMNSPTEFKSLVYVKKWLQTKSAILFRMNTGVLQVNFKDNTMLIMNSEAKKVTFFDAKGNTFISSLEHASSSNNPDLAKRVKYTEDVLRQIWSVQTNTASTPKISQTPSSKDLTTNTSGVDLNQKIMSSPINRATEAEKQVRI